MDVAKEFGSLVIDGKFLDEHMMGDLEDKIWDWLQEEFGVFQGELAERGLRLRIVLERDVSG